MKKFIFFITILATQIVFSDEVKITADPWCPFTCESNSKLPGTLTEITKKILEMNGHKVNYLILPWSRAKFLTKEGKYNAIIGSSLTEAPGFIFHKTPLLNARSCLFVRKEIDWKYTNFESLKKLKIGMVQNYSYDTEFDKYAAIPNNPNVSIITGDSNLLSRLYSMLIDKRIDAIIEEEAVVGFNAKNLKWNQGVYKNAYCFEKYGVYAAFSPAIANSANLANEIDLGLIKLKKSGEIDQILKKYYEPQQ